MEGWRKIGFLLFSLENVLKVIEKLFRPIYPFYILIPMLNVGKKVSKETVFSKPNTPLDFRTCQFWLLELVVF